MTKSIDFYFAPVNDFVQNPPSPGPLYCDLQQAESLTSRNCIVGSGLGSSKNLLQEVDLIKKVTNLCKKDTNNKNKGMNINNPYKIRYSVYNLMLPDAIQGLIDAFNAGVYVQVLIEASQTNPCKTYNTLVNQFKTAGLKIPCWKFDGENSVCLGCPSPVSPTCTPACASCGKAYTCGTTISCTCAGNSSYNPESVILGGTTGPATANQGYDFKNTTGGKLLQSTDPQTTNAGPSQWGIIASEGNDALLTYNLIPILSVSCTKDYAGIMHTKMRLFVLK